MNFIKEVSQDIKDLKTPQSDLLKFALLIGVVIFIILKYVLIDNSLFIQILFWSAVGMQVLAFLYPQLLRWPYKIWMSIAFILGWFISKIVFTSIYYVVLLPIGLVVMIFNKNYLNLKYDRELMSYWIIRKDPNWDNKNKFEFLH